MESPEVLAGRLRHWYSRHGEEHAETLDTILLGERLPEEVVALARIRSQFQEARNILDHYDRHPAEAPREADGGPAEEYDLALGVRDVLSEKELAAERRFQAWVDEYQALPMRTPGPEEEREAKRSFAARRRIMLAYDGTRAAELDGLAARVDAELRDRTFARTAGSAYAIPDDPAYRRLEQEFSAAQAKLDEQAYQADADGAEERLENLADMLNQQATRAAEEGYQDLADRITRSFNAAYTRAREASPDWNVGSNRRHAYRRLAAAAAAVIVGFGFTYGAIKYLAMQHLLRERPQQVESLDAEEVAALRGEMAELRDQLKEGASREERIRHELQALSRKEERRAPASAPAARPPPPEAAPARTYEHQVYIVRRGDTLSGIHERHCSGGSWHDLEAANPGLLDDPRHWVYPGEPIVLPAGCEGSVTYRLTAAQEAQRERQGFLPVRLYRVPEGMSFADASRRLTGSAAYGEALRSGHNRLLGPSLRRDDFLHVPASVPAQEGRLYRGR